MGQRKIVRTLFFWSTWLIIFRSQSSLTLPKWPKNQKRPSNLTQQNFFGKICGMPNLFFGNSSFQNDRFGMSAHILYWLLEGLPFWKNQWRSKSISRKKNLCEHDSQKTESKNYFSHIFHLFLGSKPKYWMSRFLMWYPCEWSNCAQADCRSKDQTKISEINHRELCGL